MKKDKILPLIFGILVLLIWEFSVRFFNVPLFVLPSPSKILMALISERNDLFIHSIATLKEALIGLIIAIVLAMIIAILMDLSKTIKNTIYPHLVVTQTVPMMVMGPLFTIWLGFGETPKILMVVLMCFFPIVISFYTGLNKVDEAKINLLKTYGATKLQIYKMAKIPSSLSSLFSGMRVAATYAIGGAIVGEWLSAKVGLGYYMLRVKNGYMLDKVFATVVIIIVLSLALNFIVGLLEKMTLRYKRKVKI